MLDFIKPQDRVTVLLKSGLKRNSPLFISKTEHTFRTTIGSISVKMYSLRYNLFKENGVTCINCGLKGKYFSLEQDLYPSNPDRFHFNLYGIRDDVPVLITKDHIVPKCSGGRNTMSNFQVMCTTCNTLKGGLNNEIFLLQGN